MPDEELLTLAESGQAAHPRVLDAQVNRMLADPRASAFAENFAGQWLETRNLDVRQARSGQVPGWNADLRDAMKTETDAVLRSRAAGEPAGLRLPGRELHVSE